MGRNNDLLTDIFGRKSIGMAVLLEGSRTAGSHGPEEDDGYTGENGPVKSTDMVAEETGDGCEGRRKAVEALTRTAPDRIAALMKTKAGRITAKVQEKTRTSAVEKRKGLPDA
jgi:hypothetical protein